MEITKIIYKDENVSIIKTNIYGIVIIKKSKDCYKVFAAKTISQDDFNEMIKQLY